ncbi:M56 family metallopeptidase [Flavobacterium haoranii]|uniref:BlaR1 peptidase M56 n=1 Tax=Flavobacterium haoranii TaxID=683124 RepID=A0A1M6I230_9FLAO|nr:M56 family metallopeptidase [Flavobacterium haoranii]SHJ28502.1 BlaR1 peptidase M56 [Flavobacterium haoranii]
MESIWLYFLKVNGLLIIHYLFYIIFLKKETFFQNNRFFLLLGIVISFVLPLLSYSKIIWIEPQTVNQNFDSLLLESPIDSKTNNFNLDYIAQVGYVLISSILFFKIIIELMSFIKVLKTGKKDKVNQLILVENNSYDNPFSFFNYLVYNKEKFSKEELELIFIHENIHIKQLHSLDVLTSKFLTILLWVNPVAWLYKKAILQNLEFIADAETQNITQNSYLYQKTLLKTIGTKNQLSITNQFYQSLIKKRIVMLNTNPSNKRKQWKYSIMIPLLLVFFLSFQVKTIAQIKTATNINEVHVVEIVQFLITKNTTDAEIKKETETFKKEHGIELKVSKIKRNSANEITAISISYKDKDGNTGQLSRKSASPIEPIVFYKELEPNGKIGFGDQQMAEIAGHVQNSDNGEISWNKAIPEIETIDVKKTNNGEDIYIINGKEYSKDELKDKIVTVDGSVAINEDDFTNRKVMIFKGNSTISDETPNTNIFLNDKEISKEEMDNLDSKIIKSVNVSKNNNRNEIKIITKNSAGIPDDAVIIVNGKKINKSELDEINPDEIQTINIVKENDKKIIEIQKKKMNSDMLKAKAEMEKSKAEMENAKAEIEKSKAELEKAKVEIEKAKEEIERAKAEAEKAKTK